MPNALLKWLSTFSKHDEPLSYISVLNETIQIMNTLEMKEGGLYDTARLPYEKSEIIHAFHELFLEVNALDCPHEVEEMKHYYLFLAFFQSNDMEEESRRQNATSEYEAIQKDMKENYEEWSKIIMRKVY